MDVAGVDVDDGVDVDGMAVNGDCVDDVVIIGAPVGFSGIGIEVEVDVGIGVGIYICGCDRGDIIIPFAISSNRQII